MDLIDFIYASNQCSTIEELNKKFLDYLAGLGFDRFVMSDMSHDSTAAKENNHGIIMNYPQEWMSHYVENHYLEDDPIYQMALVARKPFTWQEVMTTTKVSKKAKKVMNEAKEFKLYNGVALTLHQPLGAMVGMGFSGSEKGARTDQNALSLINAAAHQFFIAYADLAEFKNVNLKEEIHLTRREKEVLMWVARGKTRSDIADLFSTTESTIKRHCETAFKKLQVTNATMAVAKALRMGIIKPF